MEADFGDDHGEFETLVEIVAVAGVEVDDGFVDGAGNFRRILLGDAKLPSDGAEIVEQLFH